MNIRPAEVGDRLTIVRLLKEYHAESGVPFPFLAAYAEREFRIHAEDEANCCFVAGEVPVGFLMAKTFDHQAGWGLWAKESYLFVSAGYRGNGIAGDLIAAYDAWCAKKRCVASGLSKRAGTEIDDLFMSRGYAPFDVNFIKVL